jgi:hypothetical protein
MATFCAAAHIGNRHAAANRIVLKFMGIAFRGLRWRRAEEPGGRGGQVSSGVRASMANA